jgi:hypothetical protein
MLLKFEDDIFNYGASYEYINSEQIIRIRLLRKRIRIYLLGFRKNYIFIGRTKHNMDELKKICGEIEYGI